MKTVLNEQEQLILIEAVKRYRKRVAWMLHRLQIDGHLLMSRDDDFEEEFEDGSNRWLLLDQDEDSVVSRGRTRLEAIDAAIGEHEDISKDWNADDAKDSDFKVTVIIEAYHYKESKCPSVSVDCISRSVENDVDVIEAVRQIGKIIDVKIEPVP